MSINSIVSTYRLYFIAISVVLFLIHKEAFHTNPSGLHLWAQSDHYALTEGFVHNDLDFFHPETYVHNHQFPNDWLTADASNITAVDFPVHQYIPAVLMKLTGSESPLIYRLYMFLLSLIGILYIFRICSLLHKPMWVAISVSSFIAFSPVFTYYQIRFLPSIPSFVTCLIGMFHYFRYRKAESTKDLWLFTAFLTLSALTRFTFIIPLLSVLGVESLRLLRHRAGWLGKLIPGVLSLLLIVIYLQYNSYLRQTYGSLFLNHLVPAKSLSEFIYVIQTVWTSWKWEYLTFYHYLLLLIASLFVCRSLFRKKWAFFTPEWQVIIFLCIGNLLFFIAMCGQFIAHDYYFIDSFLLPLTLLLIHAFPEKDAWQSGMFYKISGVVAVILVPGMFYADLIAQQKRADENAWSPYENSIRNYRNSAALIKQTQVPQNELLLVLTPTAPNMPFHYLKHEGFMAMKTDRKSLIKYMDFPVSYLIFENERFVSEIYPNYPEILTHMKFVASDGKITICKKEAVSGQNLYDLLKLNRRKPLLEAGTSRELVHLLEVKGKTGNIPGVYTFDAETDAGPVWKVRNSAIFNKNRLIYIEGEIHAPQIAGNQLVVSFVDNQKVVLYKTFPILPFIKDTNWNTFHVMTTLPAATSEKVELAAYIMNTDHVRYEIRKLKMVIY